MSGPGPSGLLVVDKPLGMTSHDVVAAVRRALHTRRVGHAGTLDPLASGLLPVLVGDVTRLARFLHRWPKTYVGIARLGCESPTGDAEGAPTLACHPPVPPARVLARAVEQLSGTYLQQPPAFSAKKIGGVPAHRLARRGYVPQLAPSRITVHRLRLTPWGDGAVAFAARVSSGTYMRALARDLGRLLGTGAYLERLRRTGVGPLRVFGAARLGDDREPGEPLEAFLTRPERIPLPLPSISLGPADAGRFCSGQPAGIASPDPCKGSGTLRVLGPGGQLLGIGEAMPGRGVQPRVVLAAPDSALPSTA